MSIQQQQEIEALKHRVSVLEAAVQALLKVAKAPTVDAKRSILSLTGKNG